MPAELRRIPAEQAPIGNQYTMDRTPRTATPAMSTSPRDHLSLKPDGKRTEIMLEKTQVAEAHPSDQPDLLRCHICPEIQGTFPSCNAQKQNQENQRPLRYRDRHTRIQLRTQNGLRGTLWQQITRSSPQYKRLGCVHQQ